MEAERRGGRWKGRLKAGEWKQVSLHKVMPVGRWLQLQVVMTIGSVFNQAWYSSDFSIAVKRHHEEDNS